MALLLPSEIWRSLQALWTVRTARMLIIPGTGLLTDAYGLKGSGPYNLLKWTLLAKLCGCEIVFISVGAGPIYTSVGVPRAHRGEREQLSRLSGSRVQFAGR